MLLYIWFITMMYWRVSNDKVSTLSNAPSYIQPTLPRFGNFSITLAPSPPRRIRNLLLNFEDMDPSGFEPETSCFLCYNKVDMQGRRSSAELRAQRYYLYPILFTINHSTNKKIGYYFPLMK